MIYLYVPIILYLCFQLRQAEPRLRRSPSARRSSPRPQWNPWCLGVLVLGEKSMGNMGTCDEIMGKYDEIMGKYDEIIGKYDEIMRKYDEIMKKCDEIIGKYDEIMGKYDEIMRTYDEIMGDM